MSGGLVMRRIPIAKIHVGKRARPADPQALEALKADIAERGLRNPIEVGPKVNENWQLVAGLHRLLAVEELGDKEIDAIISDDDADAMRERELMENLCRVELTVLERCQFLSQLRELYQERTGAGHGGDRRSPEATKRQNLVSWYGSVALRAGCSASTIKLQASIGFRLDTEAADRLRGTRFADHQGELQALCAVAPPMQRRVVTLLVAEDESVRAGSVAEAMSVLMVGARKPAGKPVSTKLTGLWNRASAEERQAFVSTLSEDELTDALAVRGYRLERL